MREKVQSFKEYFEKKYENQIESIAKKYVYNNRERFHTNYIPNPTSCYYAEQNVMGISFKDSNIKNEIFFHLSVIVYVQIKGRAGKYSNNSYDEDTAEEITYDTVEVYDNLISPIFLYKVDSLNKLNEIKEIHNKLELDISYLNKSEYSADFFEDYNLMVLNLSYPSSDGNVGIYKLINHGSYLEIITTSENSKDGDQSYDFKERVFVIKVEKNITITGLSHSIEYLKD